VPALPQPPKGWITIEEAALLVSVKPDLFASTIHGAGAYLMPQRVRCGQQFTVIRTRWYPNQGFASFWYNPIYPLRRDHSQCVMTHVSVVQLRRFLARWATSLLCNPNES
jgi:hypothetical protein